MSSLYMEYGLSNGAIFNDLERPLTQLSRLRYYLTLDISQKAIRYGNSYYKLQTGNRTQEI